MASTYPQTNEAPGAAGDSTPAMTHYMTLRAENPGFLLFYRMGDFYELFFEDAETAARALDIALTKRGKHQGRDIPMCGVPVHAAENYLSRLIAKGFKVAVCEQMEDPAAAKRRGAKALRREIVRLVTPGTLTEENLLKARANNFIVAVAAVGRPGDFIAAATRHRVARHFDGRPCGACGNAGKARRGFRAAATGRDFGERAFERVAAVRRNSGAPRRGV